MAKLKQWLKDTFTSFNAAVERVYASQSAWVIPEPGLRAAVRRVIKADVVPPYQEFLRRWAGLFVCGGQGVVVFASRRVPPCSCRAMSPAAPIPPAPSSPTQPPYPPSPTPWREHRYADVQFTSTPAKYIKYAAPDIAAIVDDDLFEAKARPGAGGAA